MVGKWLEGLVFTLAVGKFLELKGPCKHPGFQAALPDVVDLIVDQVSIGRIFD